MSSLSIHSPQPPNLYPFFVSMPVSETASTKGKTQILGQKIASFGTACASGIASLSHRFVACLNGPKQKIKEHLGHTWEYIKHRRLLSWGLVGSVAASAACAFLFNCIDPNLSSHGPLMGALFGAINYIVATALIEGSRRFGKHPVRIGAVVFASYVIPTALMHKVLGLQLSYLWAIPLTIAALAGHLLRGQPDDAHLYGNCPGGDECELNLKFN